MCLSHSDPDSLLNLFFNNLITTAQIFSKGNNTFILHLRLQATNKVSNFLLLIVPSRYFCGGSFCFMSWCLIYLCCWRLMYVIIFLVKLR